ncbi:universal stress protein [Nocardia spumae]|uniref:universal stress protein n=1 Tax=Nocardia spumae TaxID=2887190 RepID=UPI001D1423FB|nr:universal stress protein [Nocardia spumae]
MTDATNVGPERRIVVAVDGSATALQAVRWAAIECALRDCPLEILLSSASAPRTGLSAMEIVGGREWLRWNGERVLSEAAAMAGHVAGDIAVTTELTADPVVPALLRRSERAPMIVAGSHGRGALGRALLGSVSSAITRKAHCPVAIVHRDSVIGVERDERPVAVGVNDETAPIDRAFDEASVRGVALMALRACDEVVGAFALAGELGRVRADETRALAAHLAPWTRRYPQVPVETTVAFDSPAHVLLGHADAAQLLVVGRHGWDGSAGIARSTRAALLHRALCPTLIVPEPRGRR